MPRKRGHSGHCGTEGSYSDSDLRTLREVKGHCDHYGRLGGIMGAERHYGRLEDQQLPGGPGEGGIVGDWWALWGYCDWLRGTVVTMGAGRHYGGLREIRGLAAIWRSRRRGAMTRQRGTAQ